MSALALRIIASVCMLLDHIGYCFSGRYPFLLPLRWIGRLAFPLYIFLLVNGFRHTSNRLRYALRLLLFAVISQVPFALLFQQGQMLGKLNVFFTLLISLLVLWATDALKNHRCTKYFAFLPTVLCFFLFDFGLLSSDYGMKGVLLAMVFYLFDGKIILTIFGMLGSLYYPYVISAAYFVLFLILGRSYRFPAFSPWSLMQLFSLLSLVPIYFYNGSRGSLPQKPAVKKAAQLGFYAFYPLHLLVLFALK